MKSTYTRKRGFTLIELMVVIAIISILASFTAPSFERHIAKANLVEVLLLSSTITGSIDEYIISKANFPDTSALSNLLPNSIPDNKIKSITSTRVDNKQGSLTVTLHDAIGIEEDQYLRYSRNAVGAWLCDTTLNMDISPENCAAAEDMDES